MKEPTRGESPDANKPEHFLTPNKPAQVSWDNSECEFHSESSVTNSQARAFMVNGPQTPLPVINILSQELAGANFSGHRDYREIPSVSSGPPVPVSTAVQPPEGHLQSESTIRARPDQSLQVDQQRNVMPFAVLNQQMMYQQMDAVLWNNMMPISTIPSHHDQLVSVISGDADTPTYQELMPVKKDGSSHVKDEIASSFSVFVSSQMKNSKNLDYVAMASSDGSGRTSTVYCKADVVVPFQFRLPQNAQDAEKLRIKVEHTDQRYQKETVERCANHRCKDESIRRNHFIRSTEGLDVADYRPYDEGYAVVVPVMCHTGLSFSCYNSCMGEQEKKSLRIVFSLEKADKNSPVIDSCSVILKVCANPLRDLSKENTKTGDEVRRNMEGRKRVGLPMSGVFQPIKEEVIKRGRISDSDRMLSDHSLTNASLSNGVTDDRVYTVSFGGGVESYRSIVSVAADKERSARYEGRRLEERGLGINLFRGVSQLHRGTDIRSWLSLPTINMTDYVSLFHQHGIYYLGDLADMYSSDCMVFHHLGLPVEVFGRLRRVFVNWYTVWVSEQTPAPQHHF